MTNVSTDQLLNRGGTAETFPPEAASKRERPRAASFIFALAPDQVEAIAQRLTQLSGAAAALSRVELIILDTPEAAIAKAGLVFAVKRSLDSKRRGWKRTVAPLSARSTTPRGALKKILKQAADIKVLARVETEQRFWPLRFGDRRAEITLDHASARMNGKEVAVASLTCASDAAKIDFFNFVTAAFDPERMRLIAETDLERIYRLCDGPLDPYVTATLPKLDADMDAAEGFRTVAGACLTQILANEAAIRASDDHEAVHQCRVGFRRLSACLRFFSNFIRGPDYDALWDAFAELRTHLREARDLDVLIAEVIAPAIAEGPVAGADALMQELEGRRAAAHADLLDTLRRPATGALFFRFAIWLSIGDWTMQTADVKAARLRQMPLLKFAQRKFATANDKFEACCAHLAEATSEERHRTRIRAKNMRYAAEFFESLARSKAARRRLRNFLKPVKELQTVLGEWNDILVARRVLMGFAEPQAGQKAPPLLAAPAAALADRIQLLGDSEFIERSAKACQALVAGEPFWRKLG